MDSPVRWGILGTGGIAGAFATDLRLTDSGDVVAVGSRSQASADRFADEFGIDHRHGSYESLVADPEVDVVYVASPHPMHHDNAMLALRAGKHVLVEKPFTMNAAEARDIVGLARERGLFAMEAMWTRFLPHVGLIRDWLVEGLLGDVVTVTADHGQWFAEDAGFRLFAPELGGGALLDLGVYPVSFASMVLGAPSRVVSMSDPAFTGVDAQTSMLFGYDSGAQAVLTCTLRAKSPTRAAIVGTEARIEVDGDFYAPAAVTLLPRNGDPIRVESVHEGRGLRHQADEVARRLAAGELESPLMPLDETISIMETMDQVLAQAHPRQAVQGNAPRETPAGAADWGAPLTKTVQWYDPLVTASGGAGLSGLEFLEALRDGKLPPAPLAMLLGFRAVEAEQGRVVFEAVPDESVYNVLGAVHGGLVCAMADTVTALAVRTTLEAGVSYTSVDLNVSYTRPVTRDSGTLRAVGTVVKPGRRVAFSRAEIFDGTGKLVATATASCLVIPGD
ncbi:MAG: Gfo/Idh/MocA family oxidoreductase [Trebonia sp.]